MNKDALTAKLLDLVEGRETPESWWSWWDEHESELETLLNRGEFLKLKPCRHGFQGRQRNLYLTVVGFIVIHQNDIVL